MEELYGFLLFGMGYYLGPLGWILAIAIPLCFWFLYYLERRKK